MHNQSTWKNLWAEANFYPIDSSLVWCSQLRSLGTDMMRACHAVGKNKGKMETRKIYEEAAPHNPHIKENIRTQWGYSKINYLADWDWFAYFIHSKNGTITDFISIWISFLVSGDRWFYRHDPTSWRLCCACVDFAQFLLWHSACFPILLRWIIISHTHINGDSAYNVYTHRFCIESHSDADFRVSPNKSRLQRWFRVENVRISWANFSIRSSSQRENCL